MTAAEASTANACDLAVVWAYRRTGKFAFHVLTGALESAPDVAHVPITFGNGVDAVCAAIDEAQRRGARVLVGWSFYSPDFAEMTEELRAVRARTSSQGVLHVCGGVHASAEPLQTLRAGFDLVAIGEGEILVREIVRAMLRGESPRGLQGTAWLDGDDAKSAPMKRNGKAERVKLDDFPPCAPAHRRHGPIEITRGCIYACRFCQTPFFAGANFRHRSVENVREWVRYFVSCNFRDYRFLTPTSMSYGTHTEQPDLAAVEALLATVRGEIGPARKLWFGTFPSEVRPEHVTHEALRLLSRYVDNRSLILGGQSGSDAMLAHSKRGHDVSTIERGAALCVEHGFVPHVDFLFGMPGETEDDVQKTLQLMDRLVAQGARVHGHTFLPLPGTPFRRAAPGALTPELRQRLVRLASQGAVYGQWEQQETTAKEMAARREA